MSKLRKRLPPVATVKVKGTTRVEVDIDVDIGMGSTNPLLVSTCMFVVMLSIYGGTLSRTIAGGDAGELATCACKGSVPHPPGITHHKGAGLISSL
jgi:hypothetical protein